MKMISPPYLQKGDKIGVVACARKVSETEMQPAFEILRNWGLEVVTGEHLFGSFRQFSGTDQERASDLQKMLDDPSIKAVISARGGYGTIRLLDMLDFAQLQIHPKWIVGYSDITALHSHLNGQGIAAIHGTMPINFMQNEEATLSLKRALFGEELQHTAPHFSANRRGTASAKLVGGNLSLLYALQGSGSSLNTKGRILFLEDLDEYLYHVDRMIISLKRAGALRDLAGLVIGGMTQMKDNTIPFGAIAEEIIHDAVKEYDYPVCYNFPAGHIDRNLALRLGQEVALEVGSNGAGLTWK